ncbi:MAG: hypothetical protein AB7T37_17080 [Dehalococcoidia bacterium]
MASRFPRGTDFPGEFFVQESLRKWFEQHGFEVTTGQSNPDLLARSPKGASWHVEAKGQTSQVGLDFRTGLGQLLQGMSEPVTVYAMGIPNTPQFHAQCQRVSDWVRSRLSVWWLFVHEDGSVAAVAPPGSNVEAPG